MLGATTAPEPFGSQGTGKSLWCLRLRATDLPNDEPKSVTPGRRRLGRNRYSKNSAEPCFQFQTKAGILPPGDAEALVLASDAPKIADGTEGRDVARPINQQIEKHRRRIGGSIGIPARLIRRCHPPAYVRDERGAAALHQRHRLSESETDIF
jgi:hypothetical protein